MFGVVGLLGEAGFSGGDRLFFMRPGFTHPNAEFTEAGEKAQQKLLELKIIFASAKRLQFLGRA